MPRGKEAQHSLIYWEMVDSELSTIYSKFWLEALSICRRSDSDSFSKLLNHFKQNFNYYYLNNSLIKEKYEKKIENT